MNKHSQTSTLLCIIVGFFLVLITNQWPTESESIYKLYNYDGLSYLQIAKSSPHLPGPLALDGKPIPFHHAQRALIPYSIGLLSHGLGLDEYFVFQMFNIFIMFLILYVFLLILNKIGLTHSKVLFCFSLLLFNPYFFRYFITYPLMTNDLVFLLGFIIALMGCIKKSYIPIFGGLILATIARQTGLFLFPPVAFFIFSKTEIKKKLIFLSSILFCQLLIYKLGALIALEFSGKPIIANHAFWGVYWIIDFINGNPNLFNTLVYPALKESFVGFSPMTSGPTFNELIDFLLRLIVPLFLGFLLCIFWHKNLKKVEKKTLITLIFFGFFMMLTPLLMGPHVASMGASRYATQSLPAVLVLIAFLIKNDAQLEKINNSITVFIFLTFLASFHHLFSFIKQDIQMAKYFVTSMVAINLFSVYILYKSKQQLTL